MTRKTLIILGSLVTAMILVMATVGGPSQPAASSDANQLTATNGGADRQTCVWNVGDPCKMHYPQLPDPDGWDVNATEPIVLADDFLCTQSGRIKDLHFWGSWRQGITGDIADFIISFHSNIPVGPGGYSIPGDALWELYVSFDLVDTVSVIQQEYQGWYDPYTGDVFYDDHQDYFQYNICFEEFMDTAALFYQHKDSIYWLNISAIVYDPQNTHWGWKSSEWHWMDDAVWAESFYLDWMELWEPGGPVLDPIANHFWVEFDSLGNPVPTNTGGTDYYDDGTSVNGWFFYPNTGWWNIWFYDHPFDPQRYKEMFINFEWYPTEADYFLEVAVNWATPDWPPGFPPPVPPIDPGEEDLVIHRESVPIGGPGPVEYFITVPDYNPEWVSVDVMGYNVIIESDPYPGLIEHWCRPEDDSVSMDLAFVITGDPPCSPSVEVEKTVWDEVAGDWVDLVDIEVYGTAEFQIAIHNNGTCCELSDIVVVDTLDDSFEYFDAIPMPDVVNYIAEGTELTWFVQDPLPVCNWIYFNVIAGVLGPHCHTDTNYVFVEGYCQATGEYAYAADQAYVHAFETGADCGDVNGDGVVNIEDVVYLLDYMFNDGPAPIGDADVDECGSVNIGDVLYLVRFIFFAGPAPCQGSVNCNIPTGSNSIDLGCPVSVVDPNGDSVAIPVYITNDTQLGALSLGFHHNSPDIEITSVSFIGSVVNFDLLLRADVDLAANEVEIYGVGMWTTLAAQTGGLLATMWAQVPVSTPSQTVDIDTGFVPIATEIVFIPTNGGQISPAYNDCGTADVVITVTPTYVCGDADASGGVDIDDVVYLIAYIFSGGPEPVPYESGDADCSGTVDIDDAVWLINFIFSGGWQPCDTDGDGVANC